MQVYSLENYFTPLRQLSKKFLWSTYRNWSQNKNTLQFNRAYWMSIKIWMCLKLFRSLTSSYYGIIITLRNRIILWCRLWMEDLYFVFLKFKEILTNFSEVQQKIQGFLQLFSKHNDTFLTTLHMKSILQYWKTLQLLHLLIIPLLPTSPLRTLNLLKK